MGHLSRRGFITAGIVALAPAVSLIRALRGTSSSASSETDVDIVEFSDAGERKALVRVPIIVKTVEEWKRQLTPLAYHVARERGTEIPFTGEYWNLHESGLFRCRCCE